MSLLQPYFEKKIASSITRDMITGVNKMGEIFGLIFNLEVIWVNEEEVCFVVSSKELTPSYHTSFGKDKFYGEVVVDILNASSLEFVLHKAMKEVEPEFFEKYF